MWYKLATLLNNLYLSCFVPEEADVKSTRYRSFCVGCNKHSWFVGENCEVCHGEKMKQLVISLFVVLAVMIAVFAAQQYIPSGSVQNNEPEIPISESELDMLDQPIFWLYDFSSDVIPTGNPFRLYERVYPAAGFELLQGSEEFNLLASNGGVVIDMTRDHIRLLFDDGSISTYAKAWFISKDADLDRGAVDHELYWGWNWLVGNQFEFGDTICSVSDSLGGTFPNKSIVWKVDGDFVYVLGHSGPIDFTHFQNCVK